MILPPPPDGPEIVIPVLPLKSKLLVAVKVAPPENVNPCKDAQLIVGDPAATEIVAAVPLVSPVDKFRALEELEPAHVKALSIVNVAPAPNMTRSGAVRVRLPIRPDPVIENCAGVDPVVATVTAHPFKLAPPVAKSLEVGLLTGEKLRVAVFALIVKLVAVALSHGVPPVPLSTHAPEPGDNTLVLLFELTKRPPVTFWLLQSSVPAVRFAVPPLTKARLSCS